LRAKRRAEVVAEALSTRPSPGWVTVVPGQAGLVIPGEHAERAET
jgi:hypothetical protein